MCHWFNFRPGTPAPVNSSIAGVTSLKVNAGKSNSLQMGRFRVAGLFDFFFFKYTDNLKYPSSQQWKIYQTVVQFLMPLLLLKTWWRFCMEGEGLVITWMKSGPTYSLGTCKWHCSWWLYKIKDCPDCFRLMYYWAFPLFPGQWPMIVTASGSWESLMLWMQLMGGCSVRAVMTSTAPLWIIMECRLMIHRPLTSLSIFSPLPSIFRVHWTGLVVNALLSCSFISDYAGLSAHHSVKPKCQLALSAHFQSLSSSWPAQVLVHCAVGVSRSASLVLAYLMIQHHYALLEAINKIKERRWIFPNRGFLKQLRALDMKLRRTPWVMLRTSEAYRLFQLSEPQTPVFLKTSEGFAICSLEFNQFVPRMVLN